MYKCIYLENRASCKLQLMSFNVGVVGYRDCHGEIGSHTVRRTSVEYRMRKKEMNRFP